QGRVIDDLDGMYKHQIEGMKNASKTKSKKQIADVSRKNVIQFVDSKPLTASDFEIYRQLTNANLLAGKDVSSYVNAMGKFSLQDQARALRVGSVLGAMHRLVLKEQKQGLNLEAMDPVTAGLEAGKSGVDLIKTALETFSPAKLAEANLNNAKADTERARIQGIINQNNLTGLLAKAANACWNAKQNAGSQKWANCRGDGNLSQEAIWPKETCDNDLSRNRKPFPDARPFHTGRNGEDPDVADMLAKEGITGLMSSSGQFGIYRDGNATQGCQEHKWECKCTNGWDWKYIGGGPALKTYWWKHYNSDATGCNWHYSDEKSPPQPFDKAVAKDINCDTGILDYLATAIPLGTKSGE
ncbi:MAG: hypothetical protein RL011_2147, partial [Pseudomonadota bacterium]